MLHNLVFIQNVKQSGLVILSGGEINELMDQKEAAGNVERTKRRKWEKNEAVA